MLASLLGTIHVCVPLHLILLMARVFVHQIKKFIRLQISALLAHKPHAINAILQIIA